MPDPVFLPRTLIVPGLKKVSVTPQADGSIDVTAKFCDRHAERIRPPVLQSARALEAAERPGDGAADAGC